MCLSREYRSLVSCCTFVFLSFWCISARLQITVLVSTTPYMLAIHHSADNITCSIYQLQPFRNLFDERDFQRPKHVTIYLSHCEIYSTSTPASSLSFVFSWLRDQVLTMLKIGDVSLRDVTTPTPTDAFLTIVSDLCRFKFLCGTSKIKLCLSYDGFEGSLHPIQLVLTSSTAHARMG